jgi:hypothetical protein
VPIKTKSKRQPGQKRNRLRALPLPNALAWTIPDYQAVGGGGKTKIYAEDKKRKKAGEKRLLFKDAFGRTMVDGDLGRELLSAKETEAA